MTQRKSTKDHPLHLLARLACYGCDRNDHDAITGIELFAAQSAGWTGITREQEEAEALDETKNIWHWWTHIGWCPECQEDRIAFVEPNHSDT